MPYVWERQARGKHLIVIGTRHVRDPKSSMYERIERLFDRANPQVVIHENEIPPGFDALPRDRAIKAGADAGFAAYLGYRRGAIVSSGDAPVSAEIKALLKFYPAREVLVFLTAQRLIGNARNLDLKAVGAEYPSFYAEYLIRNGLPAQVGWETWGGFLEEYEAVVGNQLSSKSWNPDLVSANANSGRLSELSRATNAARDRHLLAAIRKALKEHDRVIVVFGSWHVLALEPVLENTILR